MTRVCLHFPRCSPAAAGARRATALAQRLDGQSAGRHYGDPNRLVTAVPMILYECDDPPPLSPSPLPRLSRCASRPQLLSGGSPAEVHAQRRRLTFWKLRAAEEARHVDELTTLHAKLESLAATVPEGALAADSWPPADLAKPEVCYAPY